MNHLGPMQRKSDGRFDYTYNGRAYGYCCEYDPIPEDGKIMPAQVAHDHNVKMEPFKDKFHANGHATSEEACACYRQYLLDMRLTLKPQEPENATQQHRCQVCKKFTACYAMVGSYRMFTLCPEHQTREEVEKLLNVGESWES